MGATSSATMAWRSGGQLRVTVIVKSVFAFAPNETMPVVPSPDEVLDADLCADDDPARSVRAASDRYPFKPRVDVVFWGHAHAPGGKPVSRIPARIAIASGSDKRLDKVVDVVGDRSSPQANPASFTRMPVTYARAYGGSGFDSNPVGAGFGANARTMPNIVYPHGWQRDTEPASFGPIAASGSRRLRLAGNRPIDFLGQTVTEIPPHVDVSYFQCAPEDQRIAQLDGGEWILLENLHPTHSRLTMRLPDAKGAAMVFGDNNVDTPIDMRADTLLIDGDREVCILVCRGSHPVPNEAALDRLRIAAGIALNRVPIDWTDAKNKATSQAGAATGTAMLDPNTPIEFKTPYAIAEAPTVILPANACAAAARAATAPRAAAPLAAMAAGGAPVPPAVPGATTFVAPLAQSSGKLPAMPMTGPGTTPAPGIPGAPFGGPSAAAPSHVPSPVGASTIALNAPPNVPPDFNALGSQSVPGSSSPSPLNMMMRPTDSFPAQPATGSVPNPQHLKATPPTAELGGGTDAKLTAAPYDMSQRPLAKDMFVPSKHHYAPYVAMDAPAAQDPLQPMEDASATHRLPANIWTNTRRDPPSQALDAPAPFDPLAPVGPFVPSGDVGADGFAKPERPAAKPAAGDPSSHVGAPHSREKDEAPHVAAGALRDPRDGVNAFDSGRRDAANVSSGENAAQFDEQLQASSGAKSDDRVFDSGSSVPTEQKKEWSWATSEPADSSSQQKAAPRPRAAERPAEPPPRTAIYSGFARKK